MLFLSPYCALGVDSCEAVPGRAVQTISGLKVSVGLIMRVVSLYFPGVTGVSEVLTVRRRSRSTHCFNQTEFSVDVKQTGSS